MSEFKIFLLGGVNFALLLSALIWGLRRMARQFFYARRDGIRKQMVEAARQLRGTKARACGNRHLMARVEEDIAHRRRLAQASCEKECERIAADAKRRATWIVDGAARQAEEERRRRLADVRRHILASAFVRAEALLRKRVAGEAGEGILQRGLGELRALVAARQGRRAGEEGTA